MANIVTKSYSAGDLRSMFTINNIWPSNFSYRKFRRRIAERIFGIGHLRAFHRYGLDCMHP